MANVDSPFGLRPIGNTVGSSDFQMTEYLIPDNEGTSIFQGDPVEIDDNNAGFIAVQEAVTNVDNIGVFNGCFYNASTTLKPTWSNHFVKGTTPANAEDAQAFVIDNKDQLFVGVAAAAITQENMGKTCGLTVVAAGVSTGGSTISGQSDSFLLTGAWRIRINLPGLIILQKIEQLLLPTKIQFRSKMPLLPKHPLLYRL